MNGDFSTLRFDKKKRFAKVMHQQGRVMTDADLNEACAIAAYFDETERVDVIGHSGTPAHDAAFGVVKPDGSPAVSVLWNQLSLTPGRYYVEGKMVELFPQPAGLLPLSQIVSPEPAAGKYWVILEAFERYVSPTEDPDIVEEALGGPDTSGRTRVEWNLRLVSAGTSTHCDDLVNYVPRTSFGTMSASAPAVTAASDPCTTPNVGGYQGLENQLYRIEVHQGTGSPGGVTIKWSRENGCLLSEIGQVDATQKLVEVLQPGQDSKTGFQSANFVEALKPSDLQNAIPGVIAGLLTSTDEQEVQIKPADWTAGFAAVATQGNYLRGWHGYVTGVVANTAIAIEDKGLTITFGPGDLVAGDYWIVPARAISGNVIWPGPTGAKLQLPPFGTARSYVNLGLAQNNGTNWTILSDCRHIFYPLTEQQRFVYVSGDGQEAMPGFPITGDLVVGVVNGPAPVSNAKIRWTVTSGTVNIGLQDNLTLANGMARFRISAIQSEHAVVKAELLNSSGTPVQTPILFNINESKASMVSYDPLAGCATLAGKTTVQQAIDRLASIRRMQMLGGDTQVAHRDPADPSRFLTLPEPLRVRVTSLCGPVANATVTFAVIKNNVAGTLAEIAPEGSAAFATSLSVQTDANGEARCQWKPTFGEAVPQRVRASFGSDGFAGNETIFFDYQSLTANDIAFTPHCTVLEGTTTVQQALDELCANLGQGGGCEITVGEGGKFVDLPTALEAVLEADLLNVTLCLLPAKKPHELTVLLQVGVKPGVFLEIHGGGPLTGLDVTGGGIVALGIGGLTLRDLHIRMLDAESRIEVVRCEEFEIDHCLIERIPLNQTVSLVRVRSNGNVRITASTFDARVESWGRFLLQLKAIKPDFSALLSPEIMTESADRLTKRLKPFTGMKDAELTKTKKALSEVLAKNNTKTGTYAAPIGLWQENVALVLNASTNADLAATMKQFVTSMGSVFRLLDTISGAGVALDPLSNNWVTASEFSCLVSIDGDPVPMDRETASDFAKAVRMDGAGIQGNGQVTHLAKNLFDAVVFGEEIKKWIDSAQQSPQTLSAPQSFTVEGNLFRRGTSGFWSLGLTMSNNQFSADNKVVAWAIAPQFYPVANYGRLTDSPNQLLFFSRRSVVEYQRINDLVLTPL